MTWTLCTSQAAIRKAGANASSTAVASGALLSDFSDEAEAYICNVMRYDAVTNYNSLTSNGKKVLQRVCSSLIAQMVINYDMSGYTSRSEAETMLDILENNIVKDVALIKDMDSRYYLGAN